MPPANARAMRPRLDVSDTPSGSPWVVPVPCVVLVVVRRGRLAACSRACAGFVTSVRPGGEPADRQGRAQADRDQAGEQPEPRVQRFRPERLLQRDHQQAEAEDRGGVHHGDRRADGDGLTHLRLRARPCRRPSTSSRDREQRVPRAERHGEHETPAGRARCRGCRRARRTRRGRRRVAPPRSCPPAGRTAHRRARSERGSHRRDVERARQQILRVRQEGVADAFRRDVRSRSAAPSSPTAVISRHPIAAGVVAVAIGDLARSVDRRREQPLEPQGRQTALSVAEAGVRRSAPRAVPSGRPPSAAGSRADADPSAPAQRPASMGETVPSSSVSIDGISWNVGDLRHVDHVVDPDLAGQHMDPAVEVHGEVARAGARRPARPATRPRARSSPGGSSERRTPRLMPRPRARRASSARPARTGSRSAG